MVLVIELIQDPHVLAVAEQPVDRGKVLPLSQLLVQPPEHLVGGQQETVGIKVVKGMWQCVSVKFRNCIILKMELTKGKQYTHTTGSNRQALMSQTTHRAVSGADNRRGHRWDTLQYPAEEDYCGISHIWGEGHNRGRE